MSRGFRKSLGLPDMVTNDAERLASSVLETDVADADLRSLLPTRRALYVQGSVKIDGSTPRSVMRPLRDNDEDRLAHIDATLTHLRELEKDTGRIISSLQLERRRTKADMAGNSRQAAPGRGKSRSQGSRTKPATTKKR